jgi:hypothetical protein
MSEEETANAVEKQSQEEKPWQFKPGQSGNPEGKKTGTKSYITLLEEAVKNYETAKGRNLFDRLIERAFVNDSVLIAVIKKFIPDKQYTEIKDLTPRKIIFELDDGNNKSKDNSDIPVVSTDTKED